jgi:hypothetical protein
VYSPAVTATWDAQEWQCTVCTMLQGKTAASVRPVRRIAALTGERVSVRWNGGCGI